MAPRKLLFVIGIAWSACVLLMLIVRTTISAVTLSASEYFAWTFLAAGPFADLMTTMTNGIGGNNSFAALQAGHQEIHASGDVRLTGGATGGTQGGVRMGGLRNATIATPTDLELFVGGDVVQDTGALG